MHCFSMARGFGRKGILGVHTHRPPEDVGCNLVGRLFRLVSHFSDPPTYAFDATAHDNVALPASMIPISPSYLPGSATVRV